MIAVDEFRAKLRSAVLVQLFDYWQTIRGGRLMPPWSAIKPEEIAPVLPRIWVWRLDERGEPRIRLVGESILEVTSRNIRDSTPDDLYPPAEAADIRSRILKVTGMPTCSFTDGEVFDRATRVGSGERLALPYLDDRGALGVIGASHVRMATDADGKPIRFNPKALYRLEGAEYFMRLAPEEGGGA
ncbi:MAG TPA: PAS domain-containing protein [Aliidongia sp.]|nr:PAS domain-containing protein [Aliidongia sp.]